MEREYASKGVAGAGLGTGIGGLATGAPALIMSIISLLREGNHDRARAAAATAGIELSDIISLMNTWVTMNGNSSKSTCNENVPATRWDLQQAEKMAAKDAEIADYKSREFTSGEVQKLYNYIVAELGKRDDAFVAFREKTAEEFKEQAVYNAINTEGIRCLKGQVNDLKSAFNDVTAIKIPEENICNNSYPVIINNTPTDPVYTTKA